MFKTITTCSSHCDIKSLKKGANKRFGASHPSGMCIEFQATRSQFGQDSSAMMRDRQVARSLVRVAMERLPGSVKIF